MSKLLSYFPEDKNPKLFIDFSAAVMVAKIQLDCYSAPKKYTEATL